MQREATEPLYLDLHLEAGATFEQPLPAGHNAFVYVYRGDLAAGGTAVRPPAHGHPGQHRRQRRRGAASAGAEGARGHPDRRPAAERADRAVRPLRDEQPQPQPRSSRRWSDFR
jgi:redox-sensitive bicupin YhaK (pirin superfamily)